MLPFNRVHHRRHLDRAAAGFQRANFLKRRAAYDIVQRLEEIDRPFALTLDVGARDGAIAEALAASTLKDRVELLIEADLSPRMFLGRRGAFLVADEERLPFAPGRFDLVVSALALHWTNDLVGALVQVRIALKEDAQFIGTLLGGATLTELRQCLLDAEESITGGASMRVSPFVDAVDGAGLLQRAGFVRPVADVDRVQVRYNHPLKLLADLRAMGETAAPLDRSARALSRVVLARACDLYIERFASADGRIPATFELVTLTGWAPKRRA